MADSRPFAVAILAVPEVTASALFGMFDLFSSPGRDFAFITRGAAGEQLMRPYIVARTRTGFHAANGIWVQPDHDFETAPKPDIVCIPDFFVNPGDNVAGRYDPEAQWLRDMHTDGAILGSACSGAVLLGEAGLLTDREATIHWGYVATLTRNYKGVRVSANKSLVLSGEAQRVLMAGGGSSWQDLALYLIARYVGMREAIEVARVYLLQWHDMGQQPFAQLMGLRKTDDAIINECQEWIAVNYRNASPIAALTEISGLPGRTFARRFKVATGLTPMDYVHGMRLEEAKQMLETTETPVEAIAVEVGYQDTSFFTRLFRRRVGLTPAQYRRRFGYLKRALSGVQ
jgi:transcriptional regulator GlxA family with amidase domain